MAKQIIAIQHDTEDYNTGAIATYHTIDSMYVDFKNRSVSATINGYVSKAAYEAGKSPLNSNSFTIQELPESGEVTRHWIYTKAIELPPEQSMFSGATAIEA